MPTIKPGETFFDHLPDGRYEKCVLLPTTGDEPDRHATPGSSPAGGMYIGEKSAPFSVGRRGPTSLMRSARKGSM